LDLMIKMLENREFQIRKNLLDIQYNKYLQYLSMTIIISFTYFIGVAIAIFTKQIDLTVSLQRMLLAIVSIFFLGSALTLIYLFLLHLKNTISGIKNLDKQ